MKRFSTVVLVLIGLLLVSCGGGRQLPDVPPFDSISPVIAVGKAAPIQEINLGEALAELEMLPVPEGVDSALFQELKEELERQLRTKGVYKLVSKPPTGEKNRVDDLSIYNFFTLVDNSDGFYPFYRLSWSYKNVGDYNQDGTVGISDVMPVAIHFGEAADRTNEWIDGNGNYKVDIADVTPIAMNFGVNCAGCSIRGASTFPGGIFFEIGTVGFSFAVEVGDGRKLFDVLPPENEYRYFAVAPFDSGGELGEPSNVVELPNQPPVAELSANPTLGDAPLEVTFDASASTDPDGEIVSYEWDWEGDGVYDITSVGTEDASVREHTYQVGTWIPRVRVTDDDDAQAIDSVTIVVNFVL